MAFKGQEADLNFIRPWKGRELADKVRRVGKWVKKSGKCRELADKVRRVGKWVKKSGKGRELDVFEGVENITQFKNKKCDI